MATFDGPPQTVREAIDMGWTALSFECMKCHRKGYIPFDKLERRGRGHWFPASVFLLAACRKCGYRHFRQHQVPNRIRLKKKPGWEVKHSRASDFRSGVSQTQKKSSNNPYPVNTATIRRTLQNMPYYK